jgi:hypothetical protein
MLAPRRFRTFVASLACLVALIGLAAAQPSGDDPVIDKLIAVVKSKEEPLAKRLNACQALGKRGAKAKQAVPASCDFTKEVMKSELKGSKEARKTVEQLLDVLGNFGPEAHAAGPMLMDYMKAPFKGEAGDLDTYLRVKGAFPSSVVIPTLAQIEYVEALPVMYQFLSGNTPSSLRLLSVRAIGQLGSAKRATAKDRETALLELRLVAETDVEVGIQTAAREAIAAIEDASANPKAAPTGGEEDKGRGKSDAPSPAKIPALPYNPPANPIVVQGDAPSPAKTAASSQAPVAGGAKETPMGVGPAGIRLLVFCYNLDVILQQNPGETDADFAKRCQASSFEGREWYVKDLQDQREALTKKWPVTQAAYEMKVLQEIRSQFEKELTMYLEYQASFDNVTETGKIARQGYQWSIDHTLRRIDIVDVRIKSVQAKLNP